MVSNGYPGEDIIWPEHNGDILGMPCLTLHFLTPFVDIILGGCNSCKCPRCIGDLEMISWDISKFNTTLKKDTHTNKSTWIEHESNCTLDHIRLASTDLINHHKAFRPGRVRTRSQHSRPAGSYPPAGGGWPVHLHRRWGRGDQRLFARTSAGRRCAHSCALGVPNVPPWSKYVQECPRSKRWPYVALRVL